RLAECFVRGRDVQVMCAGVPPDLCGAPELHAGRRDGGGRGRCNGRRSLSTVRQNYWDTTTSKRGGRPMHKQRYPTALYGGTSKDDPSRVTTEIQQQALHDWSGRDPLVESVVDEYWDDGVTGKLPLWERPEVKRLLGDIQSGRIKSVAVAYADRFGRTLLDGLQAVKRLEELGVKLVAVNDGWDARRNDSPLYFQVRMI